MFQLEHFCVGVGSREKKGLDSSKCVSALQSFYFTQLVISGAIRHICARHSFSPAAPLSIETSISPPYFRLEILKLHPFIGCTFIAVSFSTNQLGTSSRKSAFHRTTPPNGRCKNSTKIWKKILINSYACFLLDTLADTYKRRWNDEWKMSKKKMASENSSRHRWKWMHTHAHTHTLTFFDFLFSSDSPSLTILVAFHWSVSGPIRFHLRSQDWQKNNNKENMFQNDFVLIFSFFFLSPSLRVSEWEGISFSSRGWVAFLFISARWPSRWTTGTRRPGSALRPWWPTQQQQSV